jgi:hypothetical protein
MLAKFFLRSFEREPLPKRTRLLLRLPLLLELLRGDTDASDTAADPASPLAGEDGASAGKEEEEVVGAVLGGVGAAAAAAEGTEEEEEEEGDDGTTADGRVDVELDEVCGTEE